MKSIFAIFMLTALPAAAHDGIHIHPHGGETILTALLLLAVAAVFGLWMRGR